MRERPMTEAESALIEAALAYNLDEAQAIACRDALAREAGEQP